MKALPGSVLVLPLLPAGSESLPSQFLSLGGLGSWDGPAMSNMTTRGPKSPHKGSVGLTTQDHPASPMDTGVGPPLGPQPALSLHDPMCQALCLQRGGISSQSD